MHQVGPVWDYYYGMIAVGEVFVVAIEAAAVVCVVRKCAEVRPVGIWWKAFGISLVLNALSFLASAVIVPWRPPS